MDTESPDAPVSAANPESPSAEAMPVARPAGPPVPRLDQGSDRNIRFAVSALCVGLLVLGLWWRFVHLDSPRTFSFDEHHFVSNARNYIAHRPDWNDHPPLGKLVLVPGMLVFGDRGLGWRVSSALFGLAMIALVGLSVAKLFDDRRAGLLAAAFVAIDGFFISYARTALIDNPLTAFMYAALALMLWARSWRWFLAAAACVGLAVASKWTGVCVLLLAPLLLRRARRSAWHAAWMFAVAALVYLGVEVFALYLTRQPLSLVGMMRTHWSLLRHHAGFTVWDNAASSKWYTWPFLVHPIVLHYEKIGPGHVRASSTIGNLLLWFGTTGAVVLAVMDLLRAGARWLRYRLPVAAIHRRDGLLLVGMVALTLPFIVTHRESYIFHYLGAYGLGLGLLAGRLSRIEERSAWPVLGFVACAAVVSLFYLPLAIGTTQTTHAFLLRLPFPSWR